MSHPVVPPPRRAPAVAPVRAAHPRRVPAQPPAELRALTVELEVPAGAGYPADHELVELAEVLREMAQELAPWVSGARVSLTTTSPTTSPTSPTAVTPVA